MTLGLHRIFVLLYILVVAQSQDTLEEADISASMTIGPLSISTDSGSSLYRPYQAPLDASKYPEVPQHLILEQVHIFVRHGERTPVGIRLADPPANVPEHWIMCNSARRFEKAVAEHTSADKSLHLKRLVERADGSVVPGECLLGELTDVGRKSTLSYGKALREIYVDKLRFLPDLLEAGSTYFRSTNMPRTIESLNQIIHGLYPSIKCSPSTVPTVVVRNGKDENLLGNTFSCKRLEILQVGFAQAAAAAYNHTFEPFDKKLSKYFGGNPLRIDSKPRASGVLDTVRAAIAHDVKVPSEFEDKSIMDVMERAVVTEWFADKTEEVRRLGMGRMLDDLSRKMQHKVEYGHKDPLKLLVHSTHDTALAGLCSTLDVFDEKWPAFTASITFELFKKETDGTQISPTSSLLQNILSMSTLTRKPQAEYYVRMRYQNKNMYLPFCSDDGKHLEGSPEFCTLAAFRDRVKELTPVDWEAECAPSGRLP